MIPFSKSPSKVAEGRRRRQLADAADALFAGFSTASVATNRHSQPVPVQAAPSDYSPQLHKGHKAGEHALLHHAAKRTELEEAQVYQSSDTHAGNSHLDNYETDQFGSNTLRKLYQPPAWVLGCAAGSLSYVWAYFSLQEDAHKTRSHTTEAVSAEVRHISETAGSFLWAAISQAFVALLAIGLVIGLLSAWAGAAVANRTSRHGEAQVLVGSWRWWFLLMVEVMRYAALTFAHVLAWTFSAVAAMSSAVALAAAAQSAAATDMHRSDIGAPKATIVSASTHKAEHRKCRVSPDHVTGEGDYRQRISPRAMARRSLLDVNTSRGPQRVHRNSLKTQSRTPSSGPHGQTQDLPAEKQSEPLMERTESPPPPPPLSSASDDENDDQPMKSNSTSGFSIKRGPELRTEPLPDPQHIGDEILSHGLAPDQITQLLHNLQAAAHELNTPSKTHQSKSTLNSGAQSDRGDADEEQLGVLSAQVYKHIARHSQLPESIVFECEHRCGFSSPSFEEVSDHELRCVNAEGHRIASKSRSP